jgi:hypothetical protein
LVIEKNEYKYLGLSLDFTFSSFFLQFNINIDERRFKPKNYLVPTTSQNHHSHQHHTNNKMQLIKTAQLSSVVILAMTTLTGANKVFEPTFVKRTNLTNFHPESKRNQVQPRSAFQIVVARGLQSRIHRSGRGWNDWTR